MIDLGALVARRRRRTRIFIAAGRRRCSKLFEQAAARPAGSPASMSSISPRARRARDRGRLYRYVLARSGRSIPVPAGSTIIDALFAAGLDPPHSCLEGVCGTCETAVISGEPLHRDLVLTDAERAAGKTMMICCSGSKSATLVLDL